MDFEAAVDAYRKAKAPFFNSNEFREDVARWFFEAGRRSEREEIRQEGFTPIETAALRRIA
jgi:hypothetical protein